jgi:hypothetical protein
MSRLMPGYAQIIVRGSHAFRKWDYFGSELGAPSFPMLFAIR